MATKTITSYFSKLVGVSFEGRQDVICNLVGNEKLRFRREPENEYDPNAVAVDVLPYEDEDWLQIGYIAKDKNIELAKILDAKKHAQVTLKEITGGDKKSYGVNVGVEYEQAKKTSGNRKLLKAFVGGEVYYDDDAHEYTNEAGEVYLSGSVYAKSFQKPFDKDRIAKLMANKVQEVNPEDIIAMWELKSETSKSLGNAIHGALQLYIQYGELAEALGKTTHAHDHPVLKNAVDSFMEAQKGETLLSEVLVVDHEAKRAGQIDLINIIDPYNKICRVQDFKTNVKEDKLYWEKQLDFYARILEKHGWIVQGKDIFQYTDGWRQITL